MNFIVVWMLVVSSFGTYSGETVQVISKFESFEDCKSAMTELSVQLVRSSLNCVKARVLVND